MNDILKFLKNLDNNNNKSWMDENRDEYHQARDHFIELVKEMIDRISAFDPDIMGIQPKDCIFRLNRDIRFSKDKRPYKNNFGAFISPDGKKGVRGGYYIHIQPGQHMLAGGNYMPPADVLARIRQEIDYNPEPLLKILNNKDFKSLFDGLEGEKLKTAPKGYASDHPHIDLINYKSLIVVHRPSDQKVISADFVDHASHVFRTIKPLNDYIRMALVN